MAQPLTNQGSVRTIVLVDDSRTQRSIHARQLSAAGYHIEQFDSAIRALPSLVGSPPSLAILDMMMPGMNGNELLRVLRANPNTAELPVIMLTSSSKDSLVQQALGAGADDYITRPVNPQLLLARVASILKAHDDRLLAKHVPRLQAENAALQAELSEAHRFQRALLPDVPAHWAGWSVTGAVCPSGAASGDLFDVITLSPEHHVIVLLDVCGHGIASAVVAAEARRELRTRLLDSSLCEALATLNEALSKWGTERFVSVGGVEIRGDELTVVNAGLPSIVVHGRRDVLVDGSGPPPGMFPGTHYEGQEIALDAGDYVVLVSDGLTEPFGGANDVAAAVKRLGVQSLVNAGRHPDADAVSQRLRQVVSTAESELRDDATLVLVERTP